MSTQEIPQNQTPKPRRSGLRMVEKSKTNELKAAVRKASNLNFLLFKKHCEFRTTEFIELAPYSLPH